MEQSTLEIIEGARQTLEYERREAIKKLRSKVRSLYPGNPVGDDGQFTDTFNNFGNFLDEESLVIGCEGLVIGIVRIPDLAPIRLCISVDKKSGSETIQFDVHRHFLEKFSRQTMVVGEWVSRSSFSEAIIYAAEHANSEKQTRSELRERNRPWYVVSLDWLAEHMLFPWTG